jgi:flagellar hook protein FlgE
LSVEYFGNLGVAEVMDVSFTPTVPATGASNTWTMTVTDPLTSTVVGEYTLTFDDSPGSGGSLLSVTQAPGAPGGAFVPATGSVGITIGGSTLQIGVAGTAENPGLTQLSDSFSPVAITKDGSPVGNLVGVEVDSAGMMHAIYDVGYSRTIYQIPLVDVPNPNGLISLDSQAYRVSPDSGAFFLWDAGEGPVGEMMGYAREESATDVAGELTQLIQTQRAYSSNAKIIQTVDEMLQETTNIKR